MTQRFRYAHALGGGRTATVTRLAGEHELPGPDRRRRYRIDVPAGAAWHVVNAPARVPFERSSPHAATVTVPDGLGVVTLRLRYGETHTALSLPDPSFGRACTDAVAGDASAVPVLLDGVTSAVELPLRVGPFLGVDDTVALLETVTEANAAASDNVHAHRFDLARAAVLQPNGVPVETAADLEAFVAGLDGIDAIGDLALTHAVGDLVAGHPDPANAVDTLADLGFTLDALESRDDDWLAVVVLANAVRVGGLDAARRVAADRADNAPAYDPLKDRAMHADYWERGAAWRRAVPAAVRQSRHEFGYVLANALYWTGEVTRSDSRVEELLHDAAAAVARTIGLDWVAGHARYERERAAGHRHRSARNHDRAIAHFRAAEAVAGEYDFLDAWDPRYSRAVVASNAHSRCGEHAAAVDALESGLDAVAELDPPAHRRDRITRHLRGQRRERLAIVARERGDGSTRREHLERAREHYAVIDFERSVDRIDDKLAGLEATGDAGDRDAFDERPQPIAPPRDDRGPALEDIPSLHDFLTATDPNAVGSVDPGVVHDEPPADDYY